MLNKLIRLVFLAVFIVYVLRQCGQGIAPLMERISEAPPAPEFEQHSFGNQSDAKHQATLKVRENAIKASKTKNMPASSLKREPTRKRKGSQTFTVSPIVLRWDQPKYDVANAKLPAPSIKGYALIFVARKDIVASNLELSGMSFTMQDFERANKQLGQIISASSLPQLIKNQSEQVIVINSGQQLSIALHYLPEDTYFFAISAFNAFGKFAELSQTISVDTHSDKH